MSKLLYIVVCLICILAVTASSYAERGIKLSQTREDSERRIALVIGNGAYKDSPLKNPPNDAEDMAADLKTLGFTVTKLINATQSQMRKTIRQFGHDLKKGGVGLFFYAGHGMQVKGINYLIPIGADIQEEDEVQDYAVDAGMVLRKMESAGNRLNMVFLDACRNNPFVRSFRSSQRGLAQMDAPSGSIIVYATAPGRTAADGAGRNGTFSKHLLYQLKNSNGLELGQLLKRVGKGVQSETSKRQVPWIASSITGDFYFSGNSYASKKKHMVTLAEPRPTNLNEEEEFWQAIKNSNSIQDFNDYLNNYPNGRFSKIARIKIRQLKPKKIKIESDYIVQGTNPNGRNYEGKAVIWREGDYYKMKWRIGKDTFHGKGQLSGNILKIDWGASYPVVYRITDSGVLDGSWANGKARETLTPVK